MPSYSSAAGWGKDCDMRRWLAVLVCLTTLTTACQAPQPVSLEKQTSSYRVRLRFDATTLGQRTATVSLSNTDDRPVDAEKVILVPAMPDMDMTGPETQAARVGTGRYEATAEFFTMLGEWQVTVRIVGPQATPDSVTFAVTATP